MDKYGEPAKGRKSGETEGWLSSEEIRDHFFASAYVEKNGKSDASP